MSDLPADYREQLNLRAVIARIDRDRAEALKLQEEREKFIAEQHKLLAEQKKFDRDPYVLTLAAVIAFFAAVIARLPEILHAVGIGV